MCIIGARRAGEAVIGWRLEFDANAVSWGGGCQPVGRSTAARATRWASVVPAGWVSRTPTLLSPCHALYSRAGAGLGWVVLTVPAQGGMPMAPRSSGRRLASFE